MKKILYRKFLTDCIIFFLVTLISTAVIIWIFQAVNYLDLIIEDGRDYIVYINYALLNFPKIISKILPFAFFFSFSYVIAKYELKNELLIYWNFGITKMSFVNFFLTFSVFLFLFQIALTAIIVPKSQTLSRSVIRSSDYNFFDNFIKIKKFNSAVKRLTIYTESKDKEGNYNNIYIKKDTNKNNFQITYAKKGVFKNKNGIPVLELYNGENINLNNNKITNFSFSKSEFNLSLFSPDTILVKKTQEHTTLELIVCIINLADTSIIDKDKIKKKIRNCEINNLDNIVAEIYKRLGIPLFLPALMLISLLLIIYSKEKVNYLRYRTIIFLIGFFLIIFSESTIRFINESFFNNLVIFLIPIFTIIFLYTYLLIKFKES
ncbi:LptF/LptG family permease [Candidatus Pelagibacter bacterium nBUS_30]|uniref:LptF/LptG family permease n=1 Tax=Candidatus Pelagibacter bacterium nBUS_30 TaxID=3374191 RepID=UPI003EC0958A